jgi:DNA-binding MarR family transcriptional regulator
MQKKQDNVLNPKLEDLKVVPVLEEYIGYCAFKVSQRLRFLVNEELKDYNLIANHLGVLTVINYSPLMSQVAIGEEMGVDKATMVKYIDDLEKHQFVERITDTNDRRIKNIKITKKGAQFFKKICAKRLEIEKKFLSVLTEAEEKALRKTLPKLLHS